MVTSVNSALRVTESVTNLGSIASHDAKHVRPRKLERKTFFPRFMCFIPNPGVLQNLQQGLPPMKQNTSMKARGKEDRTPSQWCMMSITDPPGTKRSVETLIP